MINDRSYMTENDDSNVKHKHSNKRKKFYTWLKEKSKKKKKKINLFFFYIGHLTGFEPATPWFFIALCTLYLVFIPWTVLAH